jgi:uncharacterized protein (DUF1499 family)
MKSIIIFFALYFCFFGCSGAKSVDLGVTNGKLSLCPDAPHCVSSQSEDDAHRMEPLTYATSKKEAQEKLVNILRSMKRIKIISINDDYLHAECISSVFRFVDDLEFYFDDVEKIIHFRSSSRMGYYDLGVNRRRIEKIKAEFHDSE